MAQRVVNIDANTKYYNLARILEATVTKFPDRPFLGYKGVKQYEWITYREFGKQVATLRTALAKKGLKQGDHIGIISKNSPEWATCAFAGYGLGVGFVAMYEKQDIAECKYIVEDSELKILFVDEATTYEAAKHWPQEIKTLQEVIYIKGPLENEHSYEFLLENAGKNITPISSTITSKDVAQIIYTSGTTGNPKGVILTHENQITSLGAVEINLPFTSEDRFFSLLPWAHILGVNGDLNYVILLGASVGLLENKEKLIDNLREVKPTFVIAVPAVLNKIHDVICTKINNTSKLLAGVFTRGVKAAEKKFYNQPLSLKERLFYFLSSLLIFKGIKRKFGGNIKYLFVGGSAMDKKVMNFYYAIGLPVLQGYGLSETSAMVSATSPQANKIGSVGKELIDDVQIKIDRTVECDDPEAGEILYKGKNVMSGYWKQPDENIKAFTEDGWFRTGDVGKFDKDGFLYIVGRIKDQYKLSNGKYVVPTVIEERFKRSLLIDNVSVLGENKAHCVAIISLNREEVNRAMKRLGQEPEFKSDSDLNNNSELISLVSKELNHLQLGMKEYEKIRNFHLTFDEWTPDNKILTHSMKIKRREVNKRYSEVIEQLYGQN